MFKLLGLLFCWCVLPHAANLSWPQRRKDGTRYQVCLDCGREHEYKGEIN